MYLLDPNSTITGSANFTVNLDIYSDIEIDDKYEKEIDFCFDECLLPQCL